MVTHTPGLKPYTSIIGRPDLGADARQLWVQMRGTVRNADPLVAEEKDQKPQEPATI